MRICVFFEDVIAEANAVLKRTPEMLPVLKEAGVVDSGGQGLVTVLEGAFDAFMGKEVDLTFEPGATQGGGVTKISPQAEADIKFGYCTEFIIVLNKEFHMQDEQELKGFLSSIGDSIVCVADDEIVKIHVHTNDPGLAIQKALTYGSLSKIKIDNMREEHQEKLIKEAEKLAAQQKAAEIPAKENGFIAVSVGEGIGEIFRGLGVDYLIQGGQTMNPSTEDMLNAIAMVPAKNIYILPNNKNIILAANQARDLTKDKNIIVVPTKTVPQGITAIISFVPERSPEENLEEMTQAIGHVRTGQVTYAVRDTKIDDKEIHHGDIMGLGDHGILAVGTDVKAVARETVDCMMHEDAELISLYYGEDFSQEEAEALAEELEDAYPSCDIEVNDGGQPIYYCLISVE